MAHHSIHPSQHNRKPLPQSPRIAPEMHENLSSAMREAQQRLLALQQQKKSHLDARVAKLLHLLEENSRLRDELAHFHQLQNAKQKLIDDVCSVNAQLQKVVLDYQAEHSRLIQEFIDKTQF